jgi:hypothetical protein
MKNLILIVAFLITTSASMAQGIFDKFEDLDGVTSVVVNQKMFKMLATMGVDIEDPEAQEYVNMANNITGFKVFTTGDQTISADMNATVQKYLKSTDLEELMRIKDGDQTVNFYVKEGKDENHVKELLMFINGLKEMTKGQNIEINGQKREIETVILSLTGDIDLRQISRLTNQMNIPGGKQLEKAGKENKED